MPHRAAARLTAARRENLFVLVFTVIAAILIALTAMFAHAKAAPPSDYSVTAFTPTSSMTLYSQELELLNLTNEFRRQHGLPPFNLDPKLQQEAREHSWDMANTGSFGHTNHPNEGENICKGYTTPQACMTTWINSPGHRANLLRNYTYMGCSIYTGKNCTAATQRFR